MWSTVKTPKRAAQSFDLVVAAVTIESMGVTPPEHAPLQRTVITNVHATFDPSGTVTLVNNQGEISPIRIISQR